jgi:sortase A
LVTVPQHQNWNQLEGNIQSGLQNGVVVHPVSHDPGSFGNFFLTGHSSYYAWDEGRFKDVFALLHEVKVGDIVEVYWEGKKYEYKIRESRVVAPTAVEVLDQPEDLKILTLMTCTPVGTNKNRLILTGELKHY